MDASGSLPISSALTDSTIWSAFFFSLIAFCGDARRPVMVLALWSAVPWSVAFGAGLA